MSVAADVSAELRNKFEALAVALVGGEPAQRTKRELRFHASGGLVVDLRKGLWIEHAAGVGGDPLDLVRYMRGGSLSEALAWARSWLGHTPGQPRPPAPAPRSAPSPMEDEYERRLKLHRAEQLWLQSSNAVGTPVETYLASRGLQLPADHFEVLRYHPACARGEGVWQAMIALMRNPATGEPCGCHRTFLALDGMDKASGTARMMMGNAGVVHLSPSDEVTTGLGIVEGIENGLSMLGIGWAPVWAAGSAGGIANFPVLAGIEAITVFADNDDGGAGAKAAWSCEERWRVAGREVVIEWPLAGSDWNDIIRRLAA